MYMLGRDNCPLEIVLNISKLIHQLPLMMIVDQGNGAHHVAVGRFPGSFHQLVANQVAERLRPVGIAGRIYWYAELPFHLFIFNGMAKNLIKYNQLQKQDPSK